MPHLATLERVEIHQEHMQDTAEPSANPDFSTSTAFDGYQPDLTRRIVIAIMALLTWLASVAFIAVVPVVFLYPYLASKGVELSDGSQIIDFAKNDPNAIFLQIIAIIPAHLLTLILAWVIITQGRKYQFLETLGWKEGGIRWWHYAIIMVAFFVVGSLVGSIFPEQENDLIRMLRSSRSAVYIIAFVATFSAPFIEELIYRGVLFSGFKKAFGVPVSFVLVTLLFALVHVPQYYPSFSTIFLLTLLSVTLTGVRVFSNNLWPCVVLHTLFNGVQSALLLIEPFVRQNANTEPAIFITSFFR